jgi:hypothetical protein
MKISLEKLKSRGEKLLLNLNPPLVSKQVKWVGSLGLLMMLTTTGFGLFFAFNERPGITLDVCKGYMLGFLSAVLTHDLACFLKGEASEIRRYIRLAKGKTRIAAWALAVACVACAATLCWLQITAPVSQLALAMVIVGSAIASEYSMLYINAVQNYREMQLRDSEQQSPAECEASEEPVT